MDRFFGLDRAAKSDKETELLMTAYSSEELAVALSILDDAQILYLTKDRGAGGAAKIIMGFNMYGTDIYVLKQQLEEAKALFESAQFVEEEEETND